MAQDDDPGDRLLPEELAELPVFPLPRVVFFPGTILPLHLFEPRYRAMIEDCMNNGPKALAVALLKPGFEPEYMGRPQIHTICGVGRIIAHERRSDGTHNIVLRGLGRVRIEELPPGGLPYRRAQATPLWDTGKVSPGSLQTLLSCATQVASLVRRQHPEFELGLDDTKDPGIIADQIADRFVSDSERRQQILETQDVDARMEQVTHAVGELLALLSAASPPS